MFKKIFFTSFLLSFIIVIYYPSRKENTKLFDYCYSLEKLLLRSSIQQRENLSSKFKLIFRDISQFGFSKTRGSVINKTINQYKSSDNSLIINLIPNKIYCLFGYWVEIVMPGKLESIINHKSKKTLNELIELKDDLNGLINNINSEYQNLKEEYNIFLKDKNF